MCCTARTVLISIVTTQAPFKYNILGAATVVVQRRVAEDDEAAGRVLVGGGLAREARIGVSPSIIKTSMSYILRSSLLTSIGIALSCLGYYRARSL